mmetsp:Transcript_63412/g.178466  ORF Transcript_63412/g.178466 Transcript_63412/m.178466 type:complete len:242 (+) Transcript_63412:302-1027(+)
MSPWPKRIWCEWRMLTTPTRRPVTPVSSRTSRCIVSTKSSPGSASPPGSFQDPWNTGSGETRSCTMRTSSRLLTTTPPTPIWVKPYLGSGLGVSGSQRVIRTYPGFAWWNSKPRAAAGPARAAQASGIFSQMPLFPAAPQDSRPSRSWASKRHAGCPAARPCTSTSTPPKRSSLASYRASAGSGGGGRPAASRTHSARRSSASFVNAHMFSSRPLVGESKKTPRSTGPETKIAVKPVAMSG